MSLWHIAWSYLWNRRFTTCLTILSVGLGVGLISTVLTLREETRKRFEEEGQAFDMVMGSKLNSPLDLVLSTVYFLSQHKGNIALSNYERLTQEEEVKGAFPISLGDTFKGFKIVGTTLELFHFDWARNPYTLAEGSYFQKPFEAVLGATVAEETGRKVGDSFISTHGMIGGHTHADHPYTIAGILARSGTPNDRAVFTGLESIWVAHEHGGEEPANHEEGEDHADGIGVRDQVTAMLIKLESPALRFQFRKRVNLEYNAMAVIPIEEIRKLYDQLLGMAKAVLLAIGYLVVVISSISILIGLYMAILQRKRDLAVMRALGASKGEIFGAVLIEAFWVTLLGLGAGWIIGTGTCWLLGLYLARYTGFQVSAITMNADLVTAYSAVVLMGLVAGILPAWQAYRSDVARDLAEL